MPATAPLSPCPPTGGLFAGLSLSNRVLTPNGDGISDQLHIDLDLLKVLDPRPVIISVYTLTGHRVALISDAATTAGRQTYQWDGRNSQGRTVAPGIYILRVTAEGDALTRSRESPDLGGLLMDRLRTNRSFFLLWLTASWITTAEADIDLWQIGGSGLEWAEHDSVAILIDETTTPGAIQPVYIQPDRSVFSYLTNWGSWTPRELGYVDGERPRVSGNLRLVDGDSTSYLAPSSGGSPDGRTFTFDLAVPVPIFSFGFYTPSQGYRSDGKSLREDVVPAYELYIAAHNPNEWRQIADVQENFRPVVQHQFPRQYVRFARYIRRLSRSLEAAQIEALQISSQAIFAKGQAHRGTIGDFELFGQGVPCVQCTRRGYSTWGRRSTSAASLGRRHRCGW